MPHRLITRITSGALLAAALAGCSRATPTTPWPPITDPVVFTDTFGANVGFQAFLGSKLDAVAIDSTQHFSGLTSLRVTVPGPGDPTGTYAGGAFVTSQARSLAGYNALSFRVRASRAVTLDVVGYGNDNTGTSRYEGRRSTVPMTTAWTHVIVPIPLPEKLARERGLFFFAEGPQTGAGLTFWLDDIEFVNASFAAPPRPILTTQTLNGFAGTSISLQGLTRTVFNLGSADTAVSVGHMPDYFTFASSNPAVGAVRSGLLDVLGGGTTTVTAALGGIVASGALTLNAQAPPSVAAPGPTWPAGDVISLFSDAYSGVPVDTWSATWDQADVADLRIAGNATKVYTNLVFSGTEFTTHPIDATAMAAFHMDVWVPGGTTFRVKLVDFGLDGAFGGTGGDADSQSELTFNAASTPALATHQWVPIEIPLAAFTGLVSRAHLAQLVLSGDTRTVFVDNVYFHR